MLVFSLPMTDGESGATPIISSSGGSGAAGEGIPSGMGGGGGLSAAAGFRQMRQQMFEV